MATYRDLTAYEYFSDEVDGKVLNVGWLGVASQDWPTGAPETGLLEALLTLTAFRSVNVTRGYHLCEICQADGLVDPEDGPLLVPFGAAHRGQVSLGSAEIHVCGEDGFTYAAPNMIVHYVDKHGYSPPLPFVRSVLREAGELERQWSDAKSELAVGASVSGTVVHSLLSGVVVRVDRVPEVSTLVRADLYRPGGFMAKPHEFPGTGERILATVAGHEEQGRTVILRVDN